MYGHDPGATRYSPLKQIDVSNVSRLQRAWTFTVASLVPKQFPLWLTVLMYVNAANAYLH